MGAKYYFIETEYCSIVHRQLAQRLTIGIALVMIFFMLVMVIIGHLGLIITPERLMKLEFLIHPAQLTGS